MVPRGSLGVLVLGSAGCCFAAPVRFACLLTCGVRVRPGFLVTRAYYAFWGRSLSFCFGTVGSCAAIFLLSALSLPGRVYGRAVRLDRLFLLRFPCGVLAVCSGCPWLVLLLPLGLLFCLGFRPSSLRGVLVPLRPWCPLLLPGGCSSVVVPAVPFSCFVWRSDGWRLEVVGGVIAGLDLWSQSFLRRFCVHF